MFALEVLRKVERVILYICYSTLVIATLLGIATRLIPGLDSIPWGMELSRYSMLWLVMLINSINIRERDEIVIEVLITRVQPGVRRVLNIISDLLVIFFLGVMLVYGFIVCTGNAAQQTASLGISMMVVYICMPLGAFCMLLEKVIVFVQDVRSKTPIKTAGEEAVEKL